MIPTRKSWLVQNQGILVPLCLFMMAGALVSHFLPLPLGFWGGWLGLTLLLTLGGVCLRPRSASLVPFVWLVAFLAGGLYFQCRLAVPGPLDIMQWRGTAFREVTGILGGYGSSLGQWVVVVQQVDGRPATGRLMVRVAKSETLPSVVQVGRVYCFSGQIKQPWGPAFAGGFDYATYLRQQGITAIMSAKAAQLLPQQPSGLHWRLLGLADALRQRMLAQFDRYLPPAQAQLIASVVLGAHAAGLEAEVKDAFRQSGLIHILAASGLNVGLIGGFFLLVGRFLRLPLTLGLILALAGVMLYCLMTGLPPSVERAGLMLSLALVFKIIRRELTPLVLLALAGAGLLVIHPQVVTMLGFQLSFLTTLGILLMVPPLQEWLGFYVRPFVAGILLVPLVAQLWVTPLLWFYFHQIQLVSLPANIVALPLVTVLTYAGFVLGGVSLVVPQVAGPLLALTAPICTALQQVAVFFAALPGATLTLPAPLVPVLLLLLAAILWLSYRLNQPGTASLRPALVILATVLLLVLVPAAMAKWQHQSQGRWLTITAYGQPVGQYLRLPHGVRVVSLHRLNDSLAYTLKDLLCQEGGGTLPVLVLAGVEGRQVPAIQKFLGEVPVGQLVVPADDITVLAPLFMAPSSALERPWPQLVPMAGTMRLSRVPLTADLLPLPEREVLQRYYWGHGCMVLTNRPVVHPASLALVGGCRMIAPVSNRPQAAALHVQ